MRAHRCKECGEEKDFDEFNPSCIRKKYWVCKKCMVKVREKRSRNVNYIIASIFNHHKHNNKGVKVHYTSDEFLEWMSENKEFFRLYRVWAGGGFAKKLRPSVVRRNSKGDYEFENLVVVPFFKTAELCGNARARCVVQLDLDGKEIARYPNARVAAKMVGIGNYSNVHAACKGEKHTAGGYKWKYSTGAYEMITQGGQDET